MTEIRTPIYPDLAGKVALVTGGSGGIGGATCRALAENQVRVVVNGRSDVAIHEVVSSIVDSGGEAFGIAADCTDSAAIERMRQEVEGEWGQVDILMAFAGGGRARPGPIDEAAEDEWHSTIDNNLTATFLTVKCFLPGMINHRSGSIVTMSSTAAQIPTPAPAAYTAAKAGVVMFTRQLAYEVGKHGIRANCLSPSTILTGRTQRFMDEDRLRELTAQHPLGRLGTPEDVALAALFLASDSAAWITGITLEVAGGRVMG